MKKLLILIIFVIVVALVAQSMDTVEEINRPETCVYIKKGLCACFFGIDDGDLEFMVVVALCKPLVKRFRENKWDKLIKRIYSTGYGYKL